MHQKERERECVERKYLIFLLEQKKDSIIRRNCVHTHTHTPSFFLPGLNKNPKTASANSRPCQGKSRCPERCDSINQTLDLSAQMSLFLFIATIHKIGRNERKQNPPLILPAQQDYFHVCKFPSSFP